MATSTEARGRTLTRRSRSNERGAALLEGVVVAAFLVIVFICLVGVAGQYKAKLLAMQDARYKTVHNALNNCELSGKAYAETRSASLLGEPPDVPGGLPAKFGLSFARVIEEGGGVSRIRSTGEFYFGAPRDSKLSGSPNGGRVSASSFMFCNEKAAGLSLAQVVNTVFDDVKDTFANDLVPALKDMIGF